MNERFQPPGGPRVPAGVRRLIRFPWSKARMIRELDDEVRFHLDMRIAELRALGRSEADAEAEARRRFGDEDELRGYRAHHAERRARRSSVAEWLASWTQDLRFAVRQFRNVPAFTIVAVLTLGLGIGATTATYSVVDAVLVRSLPFPGADQLVRVMPAHAGGRVNLSLADFLAVRSRVSSFASVAAYGTFSDGLTFASGAEPERFYGASVSGDFFKTLGVAPYLGRTFTRDDELAGAPSELVISYGLWQRRFAGAPDVIGKIVRVQGAPTPIVGVMPPGFWFPRGDVADFWMNYRVSTPPCECNFSRRVIARVASGVTPAQLESELGAAARDVRTEFPGDPSNWTFQTTSLRDSLVSGIKPVLLFLMAAVTLVLIVACVNVASLLLVRATARRTEIAVRMALGASATRLARQLFVETGALTFAGAVLGVIVSRWGLAALVALSPNAAILHDAGAGINMRVLAAALLGTIVCTFAVGVVPAMVVAGSDAEGVVRDAGRNGATQTHRRVRDVLVIAEFAISLTLVIAAGLMIRSLVKLRSVDTGIHADGLLTASVSLSRFRYDSMTKILSFTDRLQERLRAEPGVNAATVTVGLPPDDVGDQANFLVEGVPPTRSGWEPIADHLIVGDQYFTTMGIPLLQGRMFDANDRAAKHSVAIVSQSLVDRYFAGLPPLGRHIRISGDDTATVIGVVGDAAYEGLSAPTRLATYEPFDLFPMWSFSVVLRTRGDPAALATPLRRAVQSLDPEIAVAQVRTVRDLVDSSAAGSQFRATLLAVLGAAALLLAACGIYGVMSYGVSMRTRELGVRLALGADRADITALVLREGLAKAITGVVIGLLAALALTRLLQTLLFGVTATDWMTFAGVPLLLLVVALVACWWPARRASRIDPILALKSE